MTVQTHPQATKDLHLAARQGLLPARGESWLAGFGNMLAKELGEWFRTRRWLWQSLIWVIIIDGFVAFLLFVLPALASIMPALNRRRKQPSAGFHPKLVASPCISPCWQWLAQLAWSSWPRTRSSRKTVGNGGLDPLQAGGAPGFHPDQAAVEYHRRAGLYRSFARIGYLGRDFPGDPPAGAAGPLLGRSRGGSPGALLLHQPGDPAGRPVQQRGPVLGIAFGIMFGGMMHQ